MRPDVNKQLLFLYWSGLVTPMQRQLIDEWLTKPDHQELFYGWLVEWEEQHPQSKPDTDQAWITFSARLDAPAVPLSPAAPGAVVSLNRLRSVSWWLAASLVLAVGLGFLGRDALFYKTYQTAYGQVQAVNLPDGSVATLNANSRLRLLRPWVSRFIADERAVWLQGEANFSVTHQPDHQRFVVRTDGPLDVVVLGTEFLVTARAKRFRVALHTGKVLLRPTTGAGQGTLTLRPGDVFTQPTNQRASLRHQQPTQQLTAWQSHEFRFEHTTLPEVLTLLQEHFGVKVQLAHDSLATAQITGRLRANSAEDLLTAITELTGYRLIQQDGNTILIPNE